MRAESVFGCEHAFSGRESELEQIITAAHAGQSLSILAAPGIGASELLRQAYDELFLSETVIPFYFELKRSDRDAATAARRFAHEFLIQSVAYARKDPQLIAISPSLDETARLAPAEFSWIDGAIDALVSGPDIATCIAVPLRSRRGVAVIIDGLDRVRLIREGGRFLEAVTSLRGIAVIASGLRRAMYGRTPFEQMRAEELSFADRTKIIESIAKHRKVAIEDATRDLIAVQTQGSLTSVDLLLTQAADDGESLTDFAAVERVYTNSIFGGRIGRYLREKLLRPLPKGTDQLNVIRLLSETLSTDGKRLSMDHWRRRMRDVDDAALARLIRHLHLEEVISAGDGNVNMAATSRVIRDFVEARSRVLNAPEKRALTVGRAMQHNTRRAQRLMTEFYRSNAALGVRDLLEMFHGQSVAQAAVEYGPFKRDLKGQEDPAVIESLTTSDQTLELPRIIYTTDAAAFYPPLSELCDRDRSAVGLAEAGEAWLVAEIDSKLEADAATTEFWCDRLEMAALNCGLDRYQIWLIAPEGFADEALEILAARKAYGSSRHQVDLLKQLLSTPPAAEADAETNYEITVALGDEGELIAAKTVGDIAEKHGIPAKIATRIKTALVEALINAAEHSLSPDRRAELAFKVTAEAISIAISNRGLRLTDHMLSQDDGPSERRGWGLKLIRRLMDEVRIEPTDDGTRLVMIKHLAVS